jgi:hypothetical protein
MHDISYPYAVLLFRCAISTAYPIALTMLISLAVPIPAKSYAVP